MSMLRTLYIVATPIGNLHDLSQRAREVLTTVPVVLAEDTRRTKQLLNYLGVRPKLLSFHRHSKPAAGGRLLDHLKTGDLALVSDAGTPGVNDPGGILVARAVARFGEGIAVVPIPGACALIAAASVSGFPMDTFHFLGFPPHKKGREKFFDELATESGACIFYESPYRIQSALSALAARIPGRQVVVAREITKQFETIWRGTAQELAIRVAAVTPRGEYVVVVAPAKMPTGLVR